MWTYLSCAPRRTPLPCQPTWSVSRSDVTRSFPAGHWPVLCCMPPLPGDSSRRTSLLPTKYACTGAADRRRTSIQCHVDMSLSPPRHPRPRPPRTFTDSTTPWPDHRQLHPTARPKLSVRCRFAAAARCVNDVDTCTHVHMCNQTLDSMKTITQLDFYLVTTTPQQTRLPREFSTGGPCLTDTADASYAPHAHTHSHTLRGDLTVLRAPCVFRCRATSPPPPPRRLSPRTSC